MSVATGVIKFFGIVLIVWTMMANGWRHQDPAGVWMAWLIVTGMVVTVAAHAYRAYAVGMIRDRIASRRCLGCGYDLRAQRRPLPRMRSA